MEPSDGPTIAAVRQLRADLGDDIHYTPLLRCAGIEDAVGEATTVYAKLEFLQQTGTFKARGALAVLRSLDAAQRKAGVTAVSAGNHAIATAFAASTVGTSAKVVMIGSANPARVQACREFGAEIVVVDNVHKAFEVAAAIERDEGRFFVHPFEGPVIATGTGTVGLEICEQCEDFDAALIPVGGGGLIGGMANAIRQLRPQVQIIGVEPQGADSMSRSLRSGKPESLDGVHTIADSLGAPYAMPYSFELCRRNVDQIVLVDDLQLRKTMGFLFNSMRMAVEPACAATTAALMGPLRDELSGKRIVLTMCGSNIDWDTYAQQVQFGDADAA